MSDYYTESQVNRIEEDTYNGAIFEAGKEWERQRDEFNSREHELQSRIDELEKIIDKFAEAGTDLYHRVKAEWAADAAARADWRELMRTYRKNWVI
jgi:hypothetical protein